MQKTWKAQRKKHPPAITPPLDNLMYTLPRKSISMFVVIISNHGKGEQLKGPQTGRGFHIMRRGCCFVTCFCVYHLQCHWGAFYETRSELSFFVLATHFEPRQAGQMLAFCLYLEGSHWGHERLEILSGGESLNTLRLPRTDKGRREDGHGRVSGSSGWSTAGRTRTDMQATGR